MDEVPEDAAQFVTAMVEELEQRDNDGEALSYPALGKNKPARRFLNNLTELWQRLIQQTGNDCLFETQWLGIIVQLLQVLSSCVLRGVRHTAVLTASAISAGLVDVAIKAQGELQVARRQLAALKSKAPVGCCVATSTDVPPPPPALSLLFPL